MTYADQLRARMAAQHRTAGNGAREWYRVANARADRATVYLYGMIGESFWGDGTSAADFTRDLAGIDADTIELHINSDGGVISEGLAIYNALKDHPARIEAIVDGLAASSSSCVAHAGDQITMNRFSEMMIHHGLAITLCNADDHRETADLLDRASDNIAGIYAARAGGSVRSWRAAMRAETWYSAQEAVGAGLADDLVTEDPAEAAVSDYARTVTARAAQFLERTA